MKYIERNEPLYEYYLTLKNNLDCLLLQAKMNLNNHIRMDGRTGATSLLSAGGMIPVVGKIFSGAGKSLEYVNEEMIKMKLAHYSSLFQIEHSYHISMLIATKLMIDQRASIQSLTEE